MKRSLLIVAMCFAIPLAAFAQKSFQNGSNVVSLGAGFVGVVWHGTTYSANFEHGFSTHFGGGIHAGYSQYSKSGYSYTAIIVGVKGSYHFATTETVDPYAGAELGYLSVSHTGNNESAGPHSYPSAGLGIYGGVRYYVTPGVGIYGELHLSTFSLIGVGLSFKL